MICPSRCPAPCARTSARATSPRSSSALPRSRAPGCCAARRLSSAARPGSMKPSASSNPASPCAGMPPTARRVTADTVLCELEGPARAILTGERTALNFLQLLSATATRDRALRAGRCRHRLPDPRHAQDPARAAQRAEVRGALRRRPQSPHGPLRSGARQGEPHCRRRLDRCGRERRARRGARPDSRGGNRESGGIRPRPWRRNATSSCSTTSGSMTCATRWR